MNIKIDTNKGEFVGTEIDCAKFLAKHQPATVLVIVKYKGNESMQLVQKNGEWADNAALRASLIDAHNKARSIL
jgi:hypothetical protein